MNEEMTKTYIDYCHTLVEPLLGFEQLADVHRRMTNLLSEPLTRRRTLRFYAALVHGLTLSLDNDDPHRHPEPAEDSDPGTGIITSDGLRYGSPQAVADILSAGDDPAEELESVALRGLNDEFAGFILHSVIGIDEGAQWLADGISIEPEIIEAAHSAVRFALHRRRCFEGHRDPGFLVLAYHLAYAIGGGVFDTESIEAVIEDVQIPPGTYQSLVR